MPVGRCLTAASLAHRICVVAETGVSYGMLAAPRSHARTWDRSLLLVSLQSRRCTASGDSDHGFHARRLTSTASTGSAVSLAVRSGLSAPSPRIRSRSVWTSAGTAWLVRAEDRRLVGDRRLSG